MRVLLIILLLAAGGLVWLAQAPSLRRHRRADEPLAAEEPRISVAAKKPNPQTPRQIVDRMLAFAEQQRETRARYPHRVSTPTSALFDGVSELVAMGEAGIPALIELLGTPVGIWAMTGLEELAPKSIPALIAATRDPDTARRRLAAKTLHVAAPGNDEAFGALRVLLDDPDADVRNTALLTIAGYGARATGLIVARLDSADESVRRHAVKALGEVEEIPEPAVRVLVARLDVEDDWDAKTIVEALARTGTRAIEPLQTRLASSDAVVRARAMDALSQLKGVDAETIAVFLRLLENGSKRERLTAAIALARQGAHAADALPVIEEILQDHEWLESERAVNALSGYRADGADAIAMIFRCAESALAHQRGTDRIKLADGLRDTLRALGMQASAALVNGLHHESHVVRNLAYDALHPRIVTALDTGPKPGLPDLFAEARHSDAGARAAAISLLAVVAAEDARTKRLVEAGLEDTSWEVRAAAAGALWSLYADARRALPVLIEALARVPDGHPTGHRLAEPISDFGDDARFALADLKRLAKDAPNRHVRDRAQAAVNHAR